MTDTSIKIAYCGEAVDNGTMDVRDLAPALLALGDLVDKANNIINNNNSKVKVLVKSDIKKGSFEITLDVVQTLPEQVMCLVGLANQLPIREILNDLGLGCTLSGVNIPFLIKKLKGKNPTSVKKIEDDNVLLEFSETETETEKIKVSQRVLKLYRNEKVRKCFSDALSPLKTPGIDSFEVRDNLSKLVTKITNEELDYFEVPVKNEVEPIVSEKRAFMQIISLTFEENNKWRLYDGGEKLWVNIIDNNFLTQVDNGNIGFSKGDTLELLLRTTQSLTTSGLKINHDVIEVYKVHHKLKEQSLFDVPEETN